MNRLASLTAAVTNLRLVANYFDLTNSYLKDICGKLFITDRLIQTEMRDDKIYQFAFIPKGVRQIAEIAGTEVLQGIKNREGDWSEYISTEYDGIVFYQIEEKKDEKTV